MMRMYTFYSKSLLLAIALACCHTLFAQEKVSKKIERTYTLTNSGELQLDNSYGDITVTGWEKNSVAVTVNISANHRKLENAQKLLDRINPIFEKSEDFVGIGLEIAERSSSIFSRYFNKANPFDFDKSNIQIDYTVYLPIHAEMDITNKFGDVVIEDWKGKLNVDLQHGDIWINEDLNNADVALKYGKLRARAINYGNIRVKNGGVHMDASKDLRLNSSGSNVVMGKAALLEVYSSKDDIRIEEVERIRGDIRFSTIDLEAIDAYARLTLKVTDFKVAHIHGPETIIDLKQESSEINLFISDFAFRFDATLEQGLVRIPKSFENVDSKVLDKGKRIRKIQATYGSNPTGQISINGKKGVVLLNEN